MNREAVTNPPISRTAKDRCQDRPEFLTEFLTPPIGQLCQSFPEIRLFAANPKSFSSQFKLKINRATGCFS